MMYWNRFTAALRLSALGALALALPSLAAAKLCGDDIQGNDIPCACGDVVISDTILGDDPVTREECAADGLIIRVDSGHRSVSVDLHGATLRGGKMGSGILVIYGGTAGARIFSSGGKATIVGFRDGIEAHGRAAINVLSDIVVSEPKRDGVRISNGRGYRVSNVVVRDAGRHGFSLSGNGYRLRRTQALNSKQMGYFIMGERATLGAPGSGVVSQGSGDAGINMMGSGHRLVDCVAEAAAGNGISFVASRLLIHGCKANGNLKDGIRGTGGFLRIAGNRADENEGSGIEILGHDVSDLGGNRGSLNRLGGNNQPAAQCEIRGAACL